MYWAGWMARTVVVVTMASAAVTGLTHTPRAIAAEDQAKTAKSQAPKAPKSMGQLSKMDPMMVFKMVDQENKGYVTREEFLKFAEEVWKNMDNNRDGKVDRPEWMAP